MHTPLGTKRLSGRRKNHLAPLGVLLALVLASPLQAKPSGDTGRSPKKPPADAEKLIRILEPDVSPLESHPVDIVVRLHRSADADTFRASLNGQDITRRFRRQGHKRLAAVAAGDGLVAGQNRLRVRVHGHGRRQDVDVREFELVTRGVGDAPPPSLAVKVDTRVGAAGLGPYQIQVGDQQFSTSQGPFGLLIVALDRTTLLPTAQQTFDALDPTNCQPIVDFLNARSLGEIVIVTTNSGSGACNAAVGNALAQFGANPEIATLVEDDPPYTFLGVKGWGRDQAYQIVGEGSLTGYFVQDSQVKYRFLQPDYVQFVAAEFGIVIGETEYPFPCCQQGFHVLVLDGVSLAAISNKFYLTGQLQADAELAQMAADLNAVGDGSLVIIKSVGEPLVAHGDIATFQAENDNIYDTVHGDITIKCRGRGGDFVSATSGSFNIPPSGQLVSIGCPGTGHWSYAGDWSWTNTGSSRITDISVAKGLDLRPSGILKAIQRLGGNPYVFQQLGSPDSYALVGAVSPPYENAPAFPSVESSTSVVSGLEAFTANESGEIRGMLGRGHRGGFYEPIASDFDLAAPVNYDLYKIAWQAPTPWPFPIPKKDDGSDLCPSGIPTAAGLQKAYVYAGVKLCPAVKPATGGCDVRTKYSQMSSKTYSNWLSKFDNEFKDYPGGPDFSAQEFCMVRNELMIEVRWANDMNGMLGNFNTILSKVIDANNGTIHNIATDLIYLTTPHATSPIVIDVLKVIGTLAAIASAADPEPFSKGALGVLSAGLLGAANVASTAQGGPRNKIEMEASNVEKASQAAFTDVQTSLTLLIELITSDYGKLKIVGEHWEAVDPIWAWPDNVITSLENSMTLALTTHYYQQLLPLVYEILAFPHERVQAAGTPDSLCPALPPQSQVWYPSLNPSGGNSFSDQFFFTAPHGSAPPKTLTDTLFLTPGESATSLGVPKLRFFTEWLNHHVCRQ